MVNDASLIFLGGIAFYAVIWAFYGLIHLRVPREGVGAVGYGAVALSAVMTVVVMFWGLFG